MKEIKNLLTFVLILSGVVAFAQPGDNPPSTGEAGKCYAKCLIPDEYETVTEDILVRAASSKVEVVPAQYETVTESKLVKEASTVLRAVPATFETVTENILVKEASSRLRVVPAVYETVTESKLVKEASTRLETVPAVYETATENILVKEASSRIERVPAQYETQTETIVVSPASTKWVKRKADRNCLSADPNDCLVWCLVEVPERTQTVTKQVRVGCPEGYVDNGDDCTRSVEIPEIRKDRTFKRLVSPATTRTVEIPAVYENVTYQKLVTPATTVEEVIPAVYENRTYQKVVTPATTVEEAIAAVYNDVTYEKLVSPATTRTIDIPAEYKTVSKRQLVRKGGFSEWREVVCSNQVTVELVRAVQRALIARGYKLPEFGADNRLGSETKAALAKFQRDNGLPVGQLDIKTLEALGVRQ